MKFWRGQVFLLMSGDSDRQLVLGYSPSLPREARSIRELFRPDVQTTYHGRNWVASLEEREQPISSDWFTFWLGYYRDQDGPTLRERGWEVALLRDHSAGQGFFHLPTQTLFLEQIPDVDNPKTAFKMLERLLSKGLVKHFLETPWVVEIRPDVQAINFLQKLREAKQVVRLRVNMPVPNARSHALLKELQGLGGRAHADHVAVTVRAKKGSIDRGSDFVKSCCKLVVQGIASIKAWVYYDDRQKGQKPSLLSSDELTVVREHDVPEITELPRDRPASLATSQILENAIGFLTDEDVDEISPPSGPPPPPVRKPSKDTHGE